MNYKTLSLDARIKQAFGDLTAAGVDKSKARSIIALSVVESAVLWTMPREADLWYDSECWPMRVLVGLEWAEQMYKRDKNGAIVRNQNGSPVIDLLLIRQSALNDAEAKQYLVSNGWIKPMDPARNQYVVSKDLKAPYYYLSGQMAGVGTTAMAAFLEWTMDKRKTKLLDNFSIGPTMMWLANSGLYTGKANPHWPNDWDSLFQFYRTTDAASLAKKITYMDSPKGTYPSDRPADRDANIQWILRHTGYANGPDKLARARDYYDNNYAPALNRVIKLT